MCLLVPVEAGPNRPRTATAATNITLRSVLNKGSDCRPGNLLKIHFDGDKTPARCDGERTTDVQTSKSQYKPFLALLLKVPRSLVSDVEAAYFQLHELQSCLVIISTEIAFKFSLIVYFVFQRIYD